MMSPRLLPCAAAFAAALAVTGCVAPEDAGLEPVAEAEGALKRQVAVGLVQLFHGQTMVGYGYITDFGSGRTLQRWLILDNPAGNDLVFRAYDAAANPPQIADVTPDSEGWVQLVQSAWPDQTLGAQKTYTVCISDVYEQGGIYDGVQWRRLPPSPPPPAFPAWEALAEDWRGYAPDITAAPDTTSPSLVWPPGPQWLSGNALPPVYQLDPGDGKLFQFGLQNQQNPLLRGSFFASYDQEKDISVEYLFMKSDYQEAGGQDGALSTRHLGNNPFETATAEDYWDSLASQWATGTAVAINGCANYSKPATPNAL